MTDLSRSLLAAAREGLGPDAATAARVRARVASAVAPAAATTAAGSSGALLKLAALAVIAGVIATGFAIPRGPRANAPTLSLRANDTDEPAARIAPTASRESALPRARNHAATSLTAADANNASSTNREGEPASVTCEPASLAREPASLAREVELIDNAMSALRNSEPATALQTLAIFERETLGHAQLAEDAAAINLEARCALDQDVTARLAAFDAKWPSSAQRARISAACR
jgi:hypothetical protein